MALPDVAPVLAKAFVTLRIDLARMVGGDEMLARYCPKSRGIPWFAFLDAEGKVLITSDDRETGNIAYPLSDVGARHFRRMLETVTKRVTPAEIDSLLKSVKAFANAKMTT